MGVWNHVGAVAAALVMLPACSANAKPHVNAKANRASVACPSDMAEPATDTAADVAFTLLCDMNALRAQNGVRPLRWDWRLWAAAQRHAGDMAARRYISHVSLDGRALADRVLPTGYIPKNPDWMIGENLGFGTSTLSTPLATAFGWMNSPPHRENLLEPMFRDVGIGIAFGPISDGGQTGAIYVADFGMRTNDRVRPRARAHRARRR